MNDKMQYVIEVQFVATNPVADCAVSKESESNFIKSKPGRLTILCGSRLHLSLLFGPLVVDSAVRERRRSARERNEIAERQKRKLTHSFLQSRYYHISLRHVSSPHLWNERHGLTA